MADWLAGVLALISKFPERFDLSHLCPFGNERVCPGNSVARPGIPVVADCELQQRVLFGGNLLHSFRRPSNTLPQPAAESDIEQRRSRADQQLGDGVTFLACFDLFYRINRTVAHY